MKFIDLFAGLGGFHLALQRLGHTCVFACELNKDLSEIYKQNFGIKPELDIRSVKLSQIPKHDILCAGFPCQPFSKAGDQQGFKCPKWGDLFVHVTNIIDHHKPKYLFLENVPNLKRHNDGKTWEKLIDRLKELGYAVEANIISPHHFNIPQIRERVFIVGALKGLKHFEWPKKADKIEPSLQGLLDVNPTDAKALPQQLVDCLKVWQTFLELFPKDKRLPSFPIWTAEFGATYPFESATPLSLSKRSLAQYKGSHGQPLTSYYFDDPHEGLPAYAKRDGKLFPKWKIDFIRQNRKLYKQNKQWIDQWLPKLLPFHPSYQKLEWNCQGEERDIWKYIIQFRASGVRVKRPHSSPSLVAMTTSQVPVIGWELRYMTSRECARIQNLDGLSALPTSQTAAFKALGNAVNSKLVEMVAEKLVGNISVPAPFERSSPTSRPLQQPLAKCRTHPIAAVGAGRQ